MNSVPIEEIKKISSSLEAIDKSIIIGGSDSGGKGGGDSHKPTEDADNLFSESFMCVTDLLCEGQIEGVFVPKGFENQTVSTQLKRSFYLNDVPVINDDNTINYFNYTAAFSDGSQDSSQGISAKVVNIGQQLKYPTSTVPDANGRTLAGGYNYSVLSPYIKKLYIGLRVSSLYTIDTNNGDTHGNSISVSFLVNGTVLKSVSISGKTTTGFVKEYELELPEAVASESSSLNPRVVTVRKTTPEPTKGSDVQSLILDYIVEVGSESFIYPNSAIVRSKFSSRYFNQVPKRSYDIKGIKVLVPINYNPLGDDGNDQYFGRYVGDWDGTFAIAQWTDNPAWILYDILTNTRYGLGNYLDPLKIDKWALYQIARYCDERVPITNADGSIGYEPRFSCNVAIYNKDDAFKMILQFVSLFRGMVYWGGDTLSFAQDSPKDAIMQFNNSNVSNEGFTYSDIDKNSIYTVAIVAYYDANDFFQRKVIYVQNPEGVRQRGIREVSLEAWGCTSRTQAYRLAKWTLFSSLYEKELVTFKTGLEVLYLRPCDVIQVMDNDRNVDRRAGRLINIDDSKTILTLDSDIYLDQNVPATISICVPLDTSTPESSADGDGRPSLIATRNIINISQTGNTKIIEIDLPLNISGEDIDARDYIWIINTSTINPSDIYYDNQNNFNTFVSEYLNYQSSSSFSDSIDLYGYTSKLYRIINIKELDNFQYEITALQYNPNKYNLIEQNLQSDVDIIPVPTNVNLNPVTNLSVTRNNTGSSTTMQFSWTAPIGFSSASMSYVIQYVYQGVTYNAITKNGYYAIENLTNPSNTVAFTIYPSYDTKTSIAPIPEIVVSITVNVGATELSSMSVTSLEIQGQGNNTEYTSKDLGIQWSFSNPEYIDYVDYFEASIGRYDTNGNLVAFNSPTVFSTTQLSGSNLYKTSLTYDQNSASPLVPRPSQSPRQYPPYRSLDVEVKAISIYANDLSVDSSYRNFGSQTLTAVNAAPSAYYLNSGVSTSTSAQAFTVTMDNSLMPTDYNGFLLYYSTGSFNPLTVVNTGNYSSNNSNVLVIDANSTFSAVVNYPAGSPFFACVVVYDTFGKISLNIPTGVFSGIVNYGISNGVSPAPVNGFVLTPSLETDLYYNQKSFVKMQWNANAESDIEGYDIRLSTAGHNTRYYSAVSSQTISYVEVFPGLIYTGVIRAVNTQNLTSNPITGTFVSASYSNGGNSDSSSSIGHIDFFPSNTMYPESGVEYLQCSGQILPTGSYPILFSKLNYTWGIASGGAGFAIPSGLKWNNDIPAVIRIK